jgi:hypothetical protein
MSLLSLGRRRRLTKRVGPQEPFQLTPQIKIVATADVILPELEAPYRVVETSGKAAAMVQASLGRARLRAFWSSAPRTRT